MVLLLLFFTCLGVWFGRCLPFKIGLFQLRFWLAGISCLWSPDAARKLACKLRGGDDGSEIDQVITSKPIDLFYSTDAHVLFLALCSLSGVDSGRAAIALVLYFDHDLDLMSGFDWFI